MKKSYTFLLTLGILLSFGHISYAQFTVTGTVVDQNTGELLVGANIFHSESGLGTTTDANGEFSFELPGQSATIRVSYVGYTAKMVEVDASSTDIKVELSADIANLDEVVVTGLATTVKRSNLANAVSSINAEDISGKVNPPTLDGAMQGKIPGVEIMSTGGAPGGGFNVQLRGVSTLGAGNSQPLYIIDGVYVENSAIRTGRSVVSGATGAQLTNEVDAGVQDGVANRIADLNPDDIQSIEILKGPSAAAIYGQRANAGVVIINTKQGSAGETEVSVSQKVGFNGVLNLLGRTNWTEDRIIAFWDGDPSDGLNARTQLELDRFRTAQQNGTIRDLEKEFFDNHGLINKTQLSISGGDAKTRFFVSGSLDKEDGIITNTGFDRNSIRANLNHSINERITISSSTNYINTQSNRGFTGNQNDTGGSLTYNLAFHPNYAYGLLQQDQTGAYPNSPYFAENPFRLVDVATNEQDINRVLQSFNVDADLLSFGASRLSLDAQGGFDFIDANSIVYFPEFMQFQASQAFPGIVVHGENRSLNTNLQAFLVFNTEVGSSFGNLNLTSQVGWTRFTSEIAASEIQGTGLLPGQTNTDNAAQIATNQNFAETTEVGFAAQQEANWEDRIIATIGARLDRSTLNLDQDEYTLYPKGSLAVNLANFNFWNFDQVNLLKLRAAYGETGGVPLFGNTFTTLGTGTIGDRVGALAPVSSVDPNLKPERAKEIELGLDFGLFNGRISFEGTYYNKTVEDLILDLEPSPATGLTTGITTNAAELENVGWEFGLSASPIRATKFNWNTNVLWWTNESEITELVIPGQTNQALGSIGFGATRIEEGVSPTAIFGLPLTGEDQFGGLTKYGDFQPDFQMSWGNEFNYANFDFNFLFQWSKGGENIDLYQLLQDSGGNTSDYFVGNTSNIVSRTATGTAAYVQDASYIKLRETSLYYTIPNTTLEKFFGNVVKRVRFGVSGTNLLMFTDFRGYDPEVNFQGRDTLIRSVSIAPFPSSRKLLFSVDVDF